MARMGYCRHDISLKSTCPHCHAEEEQRKQEDAAKDAFVRSIVREELTATRGMKDGQSCYMIERRCHPTLKPHAWLCFDPYKEDGGMWDWTQDPNKALHFADMASCDQIAGEMPDDWDVRFTDHAWMDKS